MRLIDADAAMNAFMDECTGNESEKTFSCHDIDRILDEVPTIEATSVVHGRWVSLGVYQGHKCGVCNDYYTDDAINLFYCPRCGAKMVEIEKIEYRRNGMPIGAPHEVMVCEHGFKPEIRLEE